MAAISSYNQHSAIPGNNPNNSDNFLERLEQCQHDQTKVQNLFAELLDRLNSTCEKDELLEILDDITSINDEHNENEAFAHLQIQALCEPLKAPISTLFLNTNSRELQSACLNALGAILNVEFSWQGEANPFLIDALTEQRNIDAIHKDLKLFLQGPSFQDKDMSLFNAFNTALGVFRQHFSLYKDTLDQMCIKGNPI